MIILGLLASFKLKMTTESIPGTRAVLGLNPVNTTIHSVLSITISVAVLRTQASIVHLHHWNLH